MTLIKYKTTCGQLGGERLRPVWQVHVGERMPPLGVAGIRSNLESQCRSAMSDQASGADCETLTSDPWLCFTHDDACENPHRARSPLVSTS